jgi:hypothetical protein
MKRIRCFLLEPTGKTKHSLRRYASGSTCPSGEMSYHNAQTFVGVRPVEDAARVLEERTPRDDPRWPTHCGCGYEFKADDSWQDFTRELYRRADTGEEMTLREAPPGAMYYAPWLSDLPHYRGPDGRTLIVKCPPDGHDWIVDSRASNCTMPQDDVHKCWVRHGEAPDITVDKNGHTCAAGGGSILTPKWHGFLRNGWLEGC